MMTALFFVSAPLAAFCPQLSCMDVCMSPACSGSSSLHHNINQSSLAIASLFLISLTFTLPPYQSGTGLGGSRHCCLKGCPTVPGPGRWKGETSLLSLLKYPSLGPFLILSLSVSPGVFFFFFLKGKLVVFKPWMLCISRLRERRCVTKHWVRSLL